MRLYADVSLGRLRSVFRHELCLDDATGAVVLDPVALTLDDTAIRPSLASRPLDDGRVEVHVLWEQSLGDDRVVLARRARGWGPGGSSSRRSR